MAKLVAVSVESLDGLDSVLDPRFGRAFAFVIVDADTNTIIGELDNKTRDAAHGAGTGAAAMIANYRVSAVISGRFGPKAFRALQSLGVEMWTAPEGITVDEAVSQFVSGTLEQESAPSGGRGPGMSGGRGMGRGGGMGGGRGMGRGQGGGRGKGR